VGWSGIVLALWGGLGVPGRYRESLHDESIIRFVRMKVSLSGQGDGLVSYLQHTSYLHHLSEKLSTFPMR
jgi:hypothetical protein